MRLVPAIATVLVLTTAARAAATHPAVVASPGCVEFLLPIHASATNFDLIGLSATPARAPTKSVHVSGTFVMQSRLCEPTARNVSRADTLLVLSPGSTYNTMYWDLPFQPETYSFVRFAAARGFTTLNVARLGDGKSGHPDPALVQVPLQSALLVQLVKLARAGAIPGALGRRFQTVVGIGHSLSSAIFNDVILNAPNVLDAVVLSGYAHVGSGPGAVLPGFLPAREVLPARFGHLPDGYLTSNNITTRSGFYGPPGTFDPAVLQFDEGHKDLVTVNEFATLRLGETPAPEFRGDLLTVDGFFDMSFCPVPDCTNLASEAQFYPNARSFESAVIQGSGHDLNLHLSAPVFFQTIAKWLDRHGF